ncbi:MAG: peptide deformylase [Planctomycetes bacterium]|nr:peptide deformylase [Planctomycetota bacterium]
MSDGKSRLRIIAYPDPFLRLSAEKIEEIDDRLRSQGAEMARMMYANRGVGLAGPQVGIGRRIIVVNPTGEKKDEKILINPTIAQHRGDMEGLEGCLSVPGVGGEVHRNSYITVLALDLDGTEVELLAADFAARVFQHEIDHLNGMLFIDRMTPEARINAREALKALEEHRGPVAPSGENAL